MMRNWNSITARFARLILVVAGFWVCASMFTNQAMLVNDPFKPSHLQIPVAGAIVSSFGLIISTMIWRREKTEHQAMLDVYILPFALLGAVSVAACVYVALLKR